MEKNKKIDISFYKSIVDQDRAAVVICDLTHEIIYMNPAAVHNYEKWGGDMLVGKTDTPFTPALELVKNITQNYPVVYAYGNHEYRMCLYPETYGETGTVYEKELQKLPLTLLRNSSASFVLNGIPFRFTGLEIPAENYKKWKNYFI